MTPHLTRLVKTVQKRGHNICFYAEFTKIIIEYSLLSRALQIGLNKQCISKTDCSYTFLHGWSDKGLYCSPFDLHLLDALPHFFGYKTFFSFQNVPKNLDLSYKIDLEIKINIQVLQPFQEYCTYSERIVNHKWMKTGEHGEKPPDLSVQNLASHMCPQQGSNHTGERSNV